MGYIYICLYFRALGRQDFWRPYFLAIDYQTFSEGIAFNPIIDIYRTYTYKTGVNKRLRMSN